MQTEQAWARWPLAYNSLPLTGVLKQHCEDFVVTEVAQPEADPQGEHLYLYLEKRGMSTAFLAGQLAKQFNCETASIGYAGMKDTQAVTRQWFSVAVPNDPPAPTIAAVRELRRMRCRKKLRRGQLEANRFEILLRQTRDAATTATSTRLAHLANTGAPNYFGPQRFGRNNIARAIAWLPRRRRERDAFQRGLHLSVLRSFLFNEVLAARIQAGNWAQQICDEDEPSGPLWGRGRPQISGKLAEFEAHRLGEHTQISEALEHAGLAQQRRSLRVQPRHFEWQVDAEQIALKFELPPGCYATSVLRELGDFRVGRA